jgi:Tfp pilus assembly protein PilF
MALRRLGVLVLLLCLQPGCVLFDKRADSLKTRDEATLPPEDAARACQTVAGKLASQGHPDQAIQELLKAREYNPRADVSPLLASLYARTRRDKEALDEFNRALEAHPREADLWNDLGYFQSVRGNWAEAETNYRKAIEINAKHSKAWINLGLALGQQGKYEDSQAAFEKVCKPAEVRCNLAFVMVTQGKVDQARKLCREALELDPGLVPARNMLKQLDKGPGQPTSNVAGLTRTQ